MSIFTWLFGSRSNRSAGAPPAEQAAPQNAALSSITRGSEFWNAFVEGAGNGLAAPSESSAMAVSAVYSCVGLISGAIMSMPVEILLKNPDGSFKRQEDDDFWWLLNEEFSSRWVAAAAWDYAARSLMLHGDAFLEIERDVFGAVKGLWPLHPSRVTVVATPDARRLLYVVAVDPEMPAGANLKSRVLDQDDVIHVPGFGFDGTRSPSVLRHALRNSGSAAIAMQDYAARFFAEGARPDYTINSGQNLSPAIIEQIYAKLEEFKGFRNSHRPMVLTGGLKVEPIGMPLAEMQLLESRKFQVEEICRIYGVPPFMVGHTEKTTSWGTGIESMGVGFVRFTLRPYITRFENEMNRKLFRRGRKMLRIDTADLERADIKTLMEAIRIGIGRAGEQPIITPNEGRRMMRMADRPNGDSLEPLQRSGQQQQQPGA